MSVVAEQERADELPERWSAKAKSDVVLRLLRGEAVDAVSREIQVPAHEVEAWRRDLLDGALGKLKSRSGESADRVMQQAQATIGELTKELGLGRIFL